MQLTHFTDLALRVLMYLTQSKADERVLISEIAQQFNAPRNHLIKVVNRLAKLNWVETTRGRNGGMRLKVSANELSLGKVIRVIENCEQLIDCDKATCSLKGGCLLKGYLDQGLNAFYEKMDEYTLADVVQSPTRESIARLHIKPIDYQSTSKNNDTPQKRVDDINR